MSQWIAAITGGIASGKSTVTAQLQQLGIVVADADIAAREVVAAGTEGLAEIIATFGTAVLAADGSLDRAAMRKRIFNDAQARAQLEAIIHPKVRAYLHAQCSAAQSPYAVAAIPLLVESGARMAYPWLQRISVVDTSRQAQLQRLQQRDGIDAELAEKMLRAQASREQRLAIADDVLTNHGTLDALKTATEALHQRWLQLARAAAGA